MGLVSGVSKEIVSCPDCNRALTESNKGSGIHHCTNPKCKFQYYDANAQRIHRMDKLVSNYNTLIDQITKITEQNHIESTETIGAECAVCGGKMQFVEGDVIFGEKWFHKDCSNTRLPSN